MYIVINKNCAREDLRCLELPCQCCGIQEMMERLRVICVSSVSKF